MSTIIETTALVPVKYTSDEPTVLGRDLHKALGIGADYTTWIKRMCEYGFIEGVDYIQFLENGELKSQGINPHPKTNHQLTLDMAKEIAMIQRSEIGRKIRKYFIEVEKQYRVQKEQLTQQQTYPVTDLRAQAVIAAGHLSQALHLFFDVNPDIAKVHALHMSEKDYDVDLQAVIKLLPPVKNPTDLEELTPTMIGHKLSEVLGKEIRAQSVNTWLKEIGLQNKDGKEWKLTDEGKKYGATYPYERYGHSGYQLKWKTSVIDMILNYLQ